MAQKPITITLLALALFVGGLVLFFVFLTQTGTLPLNVAVVGGDQIGTHPVQEPQYNVSVNRDFGSPFHPGVISETQPGFVLAELYQDLSADTDDGLYDTDGHLQVRWRQQNPGCALNLPLAEQHVRREREPTRTPEPTATPMWETETVTTYDLSLIHI